jgi:hypothetical protein
MLKAWIGSMLGAALVGGGLIAARGDDGAEAGGGKAAGDCCSGTRCEATVECEGDSCVVHWTAPDGRTGEIELRCGADGKCEVVRCTPCGDGGCAPQSCEPAAAPPPPAGDGCCGTCDR